MTVEQSFKTPPCGICGKPAVGFVCQAIEQIPRSAEEDHAGVRRFEPGEKSFRCSEHFPK